LRTRKSEVSGSSMIDSIEPNPEWHRPYLRKKFMKPGNVISTLMVTIVGGVIVLIVYDWVNFKVDSVATSPAPMSVANS